MKNRMRLLALLAALAMLLAMFSASAEIGVGGTPWPDTDLRMNIPETNEGLSPKDDFNLYANYEWLRNVELPATSPDVSSFSEVAEIIKAKSIEMLSSDKAANHDTELVQAYYHACMDWDTRNELGVTPIAPMVERLRSMQTLDDLTAALTDQQFLFEIGSYVTFANSVNLLDASRYIFFVMDFTCLLRDSAEYRERTATGDATLEALNLLAKRMLPRFGYTEEEAQQVVDNAIAYESIIAQSVYTAADQGQPDYVMRILNLMTYDDLIAHMQNYPLDAIVKATGFDGINEVMVMNPATLTTLDANYTEENLPLMRDWLLLNTLKGSSSLLDRESVEAMNDANNIVMGTSGISSDEEIAYAKVRSFLMYPMDSAYIAYYDLVDTKAEIQQLCADIIAEYREILGECDWLSDETRAKALEKLDAMKINAVYPDKWQDYSGLDLSGKNFYEMNCEINRFAAEQNIGYTNGTVDPDLWILSCLDTNATYMGINNTMSIYAGILDGAFYRKDMTPEELYAGIGSVIAHEISHAFDSKGSQYDAQGAMVNWWTEEDAATFTERASKIADYMSTIVPWEDAEIDGNMVVTEITADLGGFKCALRIAEKKGLDLEKFITAYAGVWKSISTPQYELLCLQADVHPLGYLRTNVVLQMYEQFYETFGVQEGDGMYLAPEKRVGLW